jgi:tetratricopeptide (TPR) repeat protein
MESQRGETGMNGTRRLLGIALAALCLLLGSASNLRAQAPAGGQDTGAAKPQQYTQAEYNAYQACAGEANAAAKIKCLDDFVSKYPNSALLNFVYIQYSQAYGQQKNYLKMIETADKLAALGDKIDALTRFQAYFSHAVTYFQMLSDPANKDKGLDKDATLAKGAQVAANDALKVLPDAKKPEGVTDEAWAKQKTQWQITGNSIAAQAAMNAKDCSSAVNSYKAVLALNPDDAISTYQLGRAYLCTTPPQQMDAFWYFARAVVSKGATQKQAEQVKKFLKGLVANYQGGNVCDSLIDGEMNELLQLAGSSAERPSSYSLPSASDIGAVQKDMTIASVFTDLKAAGDKSKLTWLAACGLEFPEVPGKVIEVVPGDSLVLKIAFVTSDAEFDAATTPNMDVKVVGQPAAARVEKNSPIHFTGTLVSYDPDPAFFLHWDKAKVKEEDIPKEKAAPKKPVRRPPAKKPSGRSN